MPATSHNATDGAYSRSDRYYHEVVVFEVEGTLYRGFKESFCKWSQTVFRDMFSLPHNTTINMPAREGETDLFPIRLVGCTKAEFESLLELMNPSDGPGIPKLSKEQWIGVLKLARLWDMPQAAILAVERLDTFNLSPIDKILLGKAHGVPTWLKSGYRTLIGQLSEDISFEELAVLGYETVTRILWAREKLRSATDAARRSAEAGGIWVSSSDICCSHCWRAHNVYKSITVGGTRCSGCAQLHSNVPTVLVTRSYTLLTMPPKLPQDEGDPVTEKVEEIFGREIEDAERTNTWSGV